MKRWQAILAHAFAVEKPGPAKPTEAEADVVDRVLREVVKRQMATPAALFLESVRPLTYLGSQAMHFFSPFATVLIEPRSYRVFSTFLERRGAVDYLLNRLESLTTERDPTGGERGGTGGGRDPTCGGAASTSRESPDDGRH